MIKRKDFVTVLLLSLVTCGIYFLIFLYETNEDINRMVGNDGQAKDGATMIILTLVTCGIYYLYWIYVQGNRIKAVADCNHIRCDETGTFYLVMELLSYCCCGIIHWVGIYKFIDNFNRLADAYNTHLSNSGYQG